MNPVRLAAAAVLVPFSALTLTALSGEGLPGFAAAITHNLHAVQIFVDLVIVMLFWCGWVVRDTQGSARMGWAWAAAALVVGSFAPLLYAVAYGRWPGSSVGGRPGQAPRTLARIGFGLFALLTVTAMVIDGPNVPASIAHSWSSVQIWVDLVIAICFWFGWVVADARSRGVSSAPWVVVGALIGAFSPLAYLMIHGRWPASHPVSAARASR